MVNANMFADPFGDGSNPLGVSYGAIYIATAVSAVRVAIPSGIGLFIALLGLQNAGIVIPNTSTRIGFCRGDSVLPRIGEGQDVYAHGRHTIE